MLAPQRDDEMPHSSDLHAILYLSSAVRAFTQRDIDALLNTAGRNNGASGVTGLLLYHDGNICQVLEGTHGAVAATFERISADTRHKDILKIFDAPIPARCFSSWAMSYRPLEDLPDGQKEHLLDIRRVAGSQHLDGLGSNPMLDTLVRTFLSGFSEAFEDAAGAPARNAG